MVNSATSQSISDDKLLQSSSQEKVVLQLLSDDSDDSSSCVSSIVDDVAASFQPSFISIVFSEYEDEKDHRVEKQDPKKKTEEEMDQSHRHLLLLNDHKAQTVAQSTIAYSSPQRCEERIFLSTSPPLTKTPSQTSLSVSGGNGPHRRVSKTLVSLSKCLLGDSNALKVGSHIAERSPSPCFETGSSSFTDHSFALPPDLFEAVTPRSPNSPFQVATYTSFENVSTSPLLSSSGNIDGKDLIDRLTQMIKNNELKTKSSNPPISFSCDYGSRPSSPTYFEESRSPSSPSPHNKCYNSPTPSLHSCDSFASMNAETVPEELFGPHVVECVLNEMLWPQYSFCTLCHLAARFNSVEVLGWLKDCCCDENCQTGSSEHRTAPTFESQASPSISISTTNSPTMNDNDVRIQIISSSPPRLSLAVNIDSHSIPTEFHDIVTCNSAKASFSSQTSLISDETNTLTCSTIHPFTSIQYQEDQTSLTNVHTHSQDCISRQKSLWTTLDSMSASPLLYAVQYGAHEACVFLCSQPAVQSQINFTRDRFGNLPIVLALKKKDFELCDLLQLFGAKFDVIGSVSLGESLLHTALREHDIVTSEYLAKKNPKIILKKNQRDEVALFKALHDFRPTGTNKQMTVSVPGNPNSPPKNTNVKSNKIVRDSNTLGSHAATLKEFLEKAPEWFGNDLLEKAVTCKNSFGRNILLESVAINDIDSTKVICDYISRKLEMCVGRTRKQFEDMVFEPEKINSMNILQLATQISLQVCTYRSEETFVVYNGLCWLFEWLKKTFSMSCPHALAQLFTSKDAKGRTAIEIAAKEVENNFSCHMFHQLLCETELTWKSLVPALTSENSLPSINISSPSKSGSSSSETMTLSPSPSFSSNINNNGNQGGFFSKLKSKLQKRNSSRNLKE